MARRGEVLDDVDRQILESLRGDGRLSNSDVARAVGVSEATVRRRIDRLVGKKILKVVALTNPRALGLELETLIGLNVEPGSVESVEKALAPMPEVRFLGLAMGALDLLIVARFRSLDDWLAFRSELAKVSGIQRMETFQIARVAKRTYDWIFEGRESTAETKPAARGPIRKRRPAAARRVSRAATQLRRK